MTPITLPATDRNDAQLVERSLEGDRNAFGQIVARYQSLICALAYSATGSRSHSEDLAQDTFVTAWRNLGTLHEPSRLRAWLCGIARNVIHGDLRRLGRQPAHVADTLESAAEMPAADPLPTTQAVSNEEMAILWREVGRLPEAYREPLILYYREHKSVEAVAKALELTPDAVMQRLTRGRRQLQEQMLVFVETTLQRTNPGPAFTLQVQAALPILVGAGSATAAGTAAQGTGAAAKSGFMGVLLATAAPFVGLFAAIGISWSEIAQAPTQRQRRLAGRWLLLLWLSVAAFVAALHVVPRLARSIGFYHEERDWTATAPHVLVWYVFAMISVTVVVLMMRSKAALQRELEAEGTVPPSIPVSFRKRAAVMAGFLIALFWLPLFLAWQTGDRTVAWLLVAGIAVLGLVPLWLGRNRPQTAREEAWSGWYVAFCAALLLALLNWRLDDWLAPIYRVDVATMHRLLPMSVVYGLSAIAVVWTAALVFITKPNRKR